MSIDFAWANSKEKEGIVCKEDWENIFIEPNLLIKYKITLSKPKEKKSIPKKSPIVISKFNKLE